MVIKKWDPFSNMFDMPDSLEHILDEGFPRRITEDSRYRGAWVPVVDMCETDDKIVIRAELPGMDLKDMAVEIEDNRLVIKGQRRLQRDIKEDKYHRIERAHGKFYRSIRLPVSVEEEKIEAHYRSGILEIVLPKIEAARTRNIEVQSK